MFWTKHLPNIFTLPLLQEKRYHWSKQNISHILSRYIETKTWIYRDTVSFYTFYQSLKFVDSSIYFVIFEGLHILLLTQILSFVFGRKKSRMFYVLFGIIFFVMLSGGWRIFLTQQATRISTMYAMYNYPHHNNICQ